MRIPISFTPLWILGFIGISTLAAQAQTEINPRSRATELRFSRDGKQLLSAGATMGKKSLDKRLRVWDAKSGREIKRLPAQPTRSDENTVGRTLLMPDFDLMLTTWGAYEIKPIRVDSFRFDPIIPVRNGFITSLALSPDEKTLAIGASSAVEFRDARTFKLLRTYKHDAQGTQVQFGPDSTTAICTWNGNQPQAVDVETATQIAYPRWFYRVRSADAFAFSPDGERLAKALKQNIEVWTTPTSSDAGRKLKTLKTVLPVVRRLQFSPDGQTLAVGGLSQTLIPVEFFSVANLNE